MKTLYRRRPLAAGPSPWPAEQSRGLDQKAPDTYPAHGLVSGRRHLGSARAYLQIGAAGTQGISGRREGIDANPARAVLC